MNLSTMKLLKIRKRRQMNIMVLKTAKISMMRKKQPTNPRVRAIWDKLSGQERNHFAFGLIRSQTHSVILFER